MTKTTTLENVITEVHQKSINHFDETLPVQEMSFDGLNQMWISGKQIDVAPSAQRLLSNRLRVPLKIPEYAKTFGVNPGYGNLDEIVPGIAFANSEVGLLAFSIEAFFGLGHRFGHPFKP